MTDQNQAQPSNVARPARDWDEIVKASGGSMFHVPSELVERCKEWQTKRMEFNKKVNEVAQMENEIGLTFTQLVFDLRKHFEGAGVDQVWTADFGFNTEALKEGKFIVQITPNK